MQVPSVVGWATLCDQTFPGSSSDVQSKAMYLCFGRPLPSSPKGQPCLFVDRWGQLTFLGTRSQTAEVPRWWRRRWNRRWPVEFGCRRRWLRAEAVARSWSSRIARRLSLDRMESVERQRVPEPWGRRESNEQVSNLGSSLFRAIPIRARHAAEQSDLTCTRVDPCPISPLPLVDSEETLGAGAWSAAAAIDRTRKEGCALKCRRTELS